MSNANRPEQEADHDADRSSQGLNLTVAYCLLAAAIVAAVGIALFIVLPFYHRH